MVLDIVGLQISIPELIWTIISFTAFYFILKKVLYKTLLEFMYQREDYVKSARKAGSDAEKALSDCKVQVEEELSQTGIEARNIVLNAHNKSEKERAVLIEEADRKALNRQHEISQILLQEEEQNKEAIRQQMPGFVSVLANKMLQSDATRAEDALILESIQAVKEN